MALFCSYLFFRFNFFVSLGRRKTSAVNVIINLFSKQIRKAWFWGPQ